MAWAKKELTDWLKADLGVTDEELAAVLPVLEGRADKVGGAVLRQADYSRQMNGLQAKQTEYDTAVERLNAEMVEWGSMTAAEKARAGDLQQSLHASQQAVLALQQQVTTLATQAGVDPAEALKGIVVTPPIASPATAPPDLTGYLRTDDLNSALGPLAKMALTLPAQLQQIAHEHQQLTGEYLDTRTIVAEIEKRAGTRNNSRSLDPVDIWTELHDVPAKREAKATAKYNADIAAAEARGREAALSEASIPGASPHRGQGPHSPVFSKPDGSARTSVLERPQPGSTVQNAVSAFRSGRYRQASPGRPGAPGAAAP